MLHAMRGRKGRVLTCLVCHDRRPCNWYCCRLGHVDRVELSIRYRARSSIVLPCPNLGAKFGWHDKSLALLNAKMSTLSLCKITNFMSPYRWGNWNYVYKIYNCALLTYFIQTTQWRHLKWCCVGSQEHSVPRARLSGVQFIFVGVGRNNYKRSNKASYHSTKNFCRFQ